MNDEKKPSGLLATLKSSAPAVTRPGGGLAALLGGKAPAIVSPSSLPANVAVPSNWKSLKEMGGLAFLIDATGSREHSWQEAIQIQNRMFKEAGQFGELVTRLVHFQGANTLEVFPPNRWARSAGEMQNHMNTILCMSGSTQIERGLQTCLEFPQRPKVIAAIGDACEEDIENIRKSARALKKAGIPVFSFFEGNDETGHKAYQTLAKESGGIFAKFGSKLDLSSLVTTAAAYSTGGLEAVQRLAHRPGSNQEAARVVATQLLAITKQ